MRLAFASWIALIALFALIKPLSHMGFLNVDVAFTLGMSFQLYLPLWLIARTQEPLTTYGICWFGPRGLKQDLFDVVGFVLLTFIPYGLLYYLFWQTPFSFHLPPNFTRILLVNLFLVALPEEIFYRSFLQTRLLKFFRPWRVFLLVNIAFALGHFVGDYEWTRLLPFFPGLLFSVLAYRSGSILGAILYHFLCNIFSEMLYASHLFF